jgi:hypothetical protein
LVLIPCRPARFDLMAINSTVQITSLAKTRAAVVAVGIGFVGFFVIAI